MMAPGDRQRGKAKNVAEQEGNYWGIAVIRKQWLIWRTRIGDVKGLPTPSWSGTSHTYSHSTVIVGTKL